MRFRITLLTGTLLLLSGCTTLYEKFALMSTPYKEPVASCSELSRIAERKFWEVLHNGDYASIPETTKLLTAAYLENPNDPKLAAHLGFIHIWKITERAREQHIPPTITDHIILAKKYFADAVELNPNDARFHGFLGDSMLVIGQIYHDKREEVRGYFQLLHSIRMWPEFNYFTAGYPMSTLDPDSKHFKEGLMWQWKTLDVCTDSSVDRNNPDYAPYMHLETQQGPKRACWNSWIAPHNFEGFFLNMGDMLVKQGDCKTAIIIYKNARLSKNYDSWPYREMLERRIQHARQNVKNFRKDFKESEPHSPDTTIMFNSGNGCVVCHQN